MATCHEANAINTRTGPTVKIMSCIGFQKFRYCGENRPGKKYQDKDFLQLALHNMSGKNVRIQIVCFDAERKNEIHPNGLVGQNCEHGVYRKTYPVSKTAQIVRVPYLRTERIWTKKNASSNDGKPIIDSVFEKRSEILPSPFKEQCLSQLGTNQKYDTTKVCLGIIATIEESASEPLFCLSNVIQNASEKTTLQILKLSSQFISAQEGGKLDIFTTEDGPLLTEGKCTVQVVVNGNDSYWQSPEIIPNKDQLLYKRVVTCQVPIFGPNPATEVDVPATIHLSCMQSRQTCSFPFYYRTVANSHWTPAITTCPESLRKRQLNDMDDIKVKLRHKKVKPEPVGDSGPTYDLHGQPSSLPNILPQACSSAMPSDVNMAEDNQVKDLTGQPICIDSIQNFLNSNGDPTNLNLLSDTLQPGPSFVSAVGPIAATSPQAATSFPLPVVQGPTREGHPASSEQSQQMTQSYFGMGNMQESGINLSTNINASVNRVRMGVVPELSLVRQSAERGPPILIRGVPIIDSQGLISTGAPIPSSNLISLSGVFGPEAFDSQTGDLLTSSVIDMIRPYAGRYGSQS